MKTPIAIFASVMLAITPAVAFAWDNKPPVHKTYKHTSNTNKNSNTNLLKNMQGQLQGQKQKQQQQQAAKSRSHSASQANNGVSIDQSQHGSGNVTSYGDAPSIVGDFGVPGECLKRVGGQLFLPGVTTGMVGTYAGMGFQIDRNNDVCWEITSCTIAFGDWPDMLTLCMANLSPAVWRSLKQTGQIR